MYGLGRYSLWSKTYDYSLQNINHRLRVGQEKFQTLPVFRPIKQLWHGKPSHRPPSQLVIPEQEMLSNLQLLWTNLRVQRDTDLLSSVYNLVRQQNSQLLDNRILRIEENLQYALPRDNIVEEESSNDNQPSTVELVPIGTIVP